MAQIELIMPKMGESVAEATITKWLIEEGDAMEAEEPVLEIATDKVDSEVPAPENGTLVKKLYNEDDVVKVGEAIAIIETEGEATGDDDSDAANSAPSQNNSTGSNGVAQEEPSDTQSPSQPNPQPEPAAAAAVAESVAVAQETATSTIPRNHNGKFYSPLVRSIAEQENISLQELDQVDGSGAQGRVTKKDILQYLQNRGEAAQTSETPQEQPAAQPSPQPQSKPEPQAQPKQAAAPQAQGVSSGDDEIIEMDRMRKMIAEHMVHSKRNSPHVTSFVEADVTNIVNWRNKVKKEFLEREGEKITFTPIFIEAIARAIREFPMINISVDGTKLIRHKNINVGMAAALPSGNLIVPVIHNADQYNLLGLTKKVNDLANRARKNQLKPDEIQGGTYTVTNVGTFGNVLGTPIINQPQVAIMAMGSINKKPSVVETDQGDFIGIRHKMFLSHSYDHRVVDGALGGTFVRRVADFLEAFDPNRDF